MKQIRIVFDVVLVFITMLQKCVVSEKDLCEAKEFPGPHETWELYSERLLNFDGSKNLPRKPDYVYYQLSCDTSSWQNTGSNDFISSKYLIDADPLGADNWNCGSYRRSVIWACNTTSGNWTSTRRIDEGTSDYFQCHRFENVAKEDIPLRDECCTPWSDYTPLVKQPFHCIATCLWYPLRDPENGFRRWHIKRNPYTLAPQGTDVLYECNDGYHIVGDPHVRCTEIGNWTSVPICKKDKWFVHKFAPFFMIPIWVFGSFVTISLAVAYNNQVRHRLCRS